MQDPPPLQSPRSRTENARVPRRASGLLVLATLVVLGVGVTAGYLQWKAPEVQAIVDRRRSAVAEVPSTPSARLVHWLMYANALIHNRLQEMRFSAERPWLVVYTIPAAIDEPNAARSPSPSSEAEMYGVDLTELPREPARLDGLRVVVRLPRARDLGRGELVGDNAPFVPVIPASEALPDADRRARELATWALKDLGHALERDIPGTELVVEVGPETSWAEIAEVRPPPTNDAPTTPPADR